jgi:ABC-type dipeptide/oligopeptide/nickel transport system permease component
MGVAILYATICGALFGVISSRRQYSVADNCFTVVALIGYSSVFWLGQILLILFGLHVPIFPAQGMESLWESTPASPAPSTSSTTWCCRPHAGPGLSGRRCAFTAPA